MDLVEAYQAATHCPESPFPQRLIQVVLQLQHDWKWNPNDLLTQLFLRLAAALPKYPEHAHCCSQRIPHWSKTSHVDQTS